ncbi:hypothetical protein BUALT_Bualt13G0039000 [Buddleja alternifolia]|uniref:MULE transposase domain-containing protein n=1 Tax=Buddleja alternifolia TaxID=168488 RepID=A0AAV6WLK6_9LAMI|nr:hypothetical protein BUALT_Bualt13G0039000 [Buddleja alternifolia]
MDTQSDPTYQGGGDDEEESLSDSSLSDCPDWMFEDFEAPEDDDIFASRAPDHARKLFKTLRLQFPIRKKYREILRDWAVRKGWDLKFLYNETAKITATCKHGCDWRIHASPIMKTSTYQVKSLRGSHTCAHRYQTRQANYKYLGKRIENIIRDNPMEGLESLKNKIRRDVEVECSRDKLYRAKRYALELVKAIGRDGNDNIFSIAIAYVEIEKEEIWKWFLNLLLRDIGSADEKGWAFISDRQKGLVEAVHSLAPTSEHRFCLKHMYNNFKGKYKRQDLKRLFWKVASTYSVKQHLRIMKDIERISPKIGKKETAYEWMCKISSNHWTRCFFSGRTKCDALVNNISESFNSYILDARELPIIDMFEWIRRKCMTRFQVKRAGIEKFKGVICPNIQKKIENQRVISKNCFPTWAGDDKFEWATLVVMLLHLSITTTLNYHNMSYDDYVDDYLKKDIYVRVYSHMINPVPGIHDFEESPLGSVDPPNVKVRVGRPRKVRRRDGNDRRDPNCVSRVGLTHTCGICLQQGHNRSTCTNPPHPNSTVQHNKTSGNAKYVETEAAAQEEEQAQTNIDPQFESETAEGRDTAEGTDNQTPMEFDTAPLFERPSYSEYARHMESVQFNSNVNATPQMHQQPSQTASSLANKGPRADVHLPTQASSVPNVHLPKPPRNVEDH